ncbi:MAG: UDP-glucose 4-epimerase GalE [Mycobacterium sp.]
MTRGSTVLVTGGSGYIGSHTCVALIERGYEVVVVDDFSNSSPEALVRVRDLTNVMPTAYDVDIRDRNGLAEVFGRHGFDVVIHFAAKKSVPESTQIPLEYFDINLAGTINVLQVMHAHRVRRLVYSSSCSVYGDAQQGPLTESDMPCPTNPYAWTKWTCEQVIDQACRFHPELVATSLRYFNPIGAHRSGTLGEAPTGPAFNAMPLLAQVASGQLSDFTIFGTDYPTADGTAIRDYIHVLDVAEAHVVALEHIDDCAGMQIFNIGTGIGTSVLQLRNAFADASGRDIPYVTAGRRPGDVAALVADPSKVASKWNWHTGYDLNDMCRDAWRFYFRNPRGYATADG